MVNASIQTTLLPLRFGEGFFDDYAGKLITDPHVAVIELVANSWDAGAQHVTLTWPSDIKGKFEISDDGSGMTRSEFESIWNEFNYNRRKRQGNITRITDSGNKERKVYGRNGKGRHSLFCFADSYRVETWKNGMESAYEVSRLKESQFPYQIQFLDEKSRNGHGTTISCIIEKNYIEHQNLRDLIGSKFITDPSFEIILNGQKIDPMEILDQSTRHEYTIDGEGAVEIYIIDSSRAGRISRLHGVAWWVNNRLVGEHTWRDFENTYLDGRTSAAKRYSIVVKADILEDEVTADWTWFKDNARVKKIRESVNSFILESIQSLMQDVRSETKKTILNQYRGTIRQLSDFSKEQIGQFIDEIQKKCPTINQRHLSNTVEILANMEMSRTGYKLLQQLVQVSPSDIDALSKILDDWSVTQAKEVLSELHWRLEIIKRMETIIDDDKTDELHDLQPLFEKGLWIFSPEYEGVQFFPNRRLLTIVQNLFNTSEVENPKNRPDFVILPDSSIGMYGSDRYDENGNIVGISKILILELKRGGSTITKKELRQAEDYALAIQKSGKLNNNTKIICYVLGSYVDCEKSTSGANVEIIPYPYSTILRQANSRTFNLMERIKKCKKIDTLSDQEIKEVLVQTEASN